MRLRPATPGDVALLRRWDEQPHVLAGHSDSHYWGDVAPDLRAVDLWIGEAADLGKGYGTAMMRAPVVPKRRLLRLPAK